MRTSLIFSTGVLLAFALGSNGDHIYIDSPAEGAQLKQDTDVEIRYRVRYQDMALLGSANTSLMYINGTAAVANFSTATNADWDQSRLISFNWTVPKDISDGPYVIQVAGPAGYKCSKNDNGQAPWTHCYLTLTSQVNVTVGNVPVTVAESILMNNTSASVNSSATPSSAKPLMLPYSLSPPKPSQNASAMSFVEAITNEGQPLQKPIIYVSVVLLPIMYFIL